VNPAVARDFIYVDDVIDAYLLAVTVGDQPLDAVYNVGTGLQTTIREMVDVARSTLKITAQPQWSSMPDRIWDTDRWVCDSRYIRRQLGWRPRHTLKEGFEKTIIWFRDNPEVIQAYQAEQFVGASDPQ
jgi:nucleoside-diphosphate-sugar epimerase